MSAASRLMEAAEMVSRDRLLSHSGIWWYVEGAKITDLYEGGPVTALDYPGTLSL